MPRFYPPPRKLATLLGATLLGAAPLGAAPLGAEQEPATTRVERGGAALEGYLAAREARPMNFSPQGELAILTRFGEVEELHLVERAGGDRRQISFLREPVADAAFSPDPQRIALVFRVDSGGDERWQLYYRRLGEAQARQLTDGSSAAGQALWSNDGHCLAFASGAPGAASVEVEWVKPESGDLPRLAAGGEAGAWRPLDWSPDDRKLLVLKRLSAIESHLYVVDLESAERREVDAAPAAVNIVDAKFARDGQGVYVVSDRDGEFARLRFVNFFNGETSVISAQTPWDVEALALSRDGHYLSYLTNEAGTSRLSLVDLQAHRELAPAHPPTAGVISNLSFDAAGERLAFGFTSANRPGDAYVLDIAQNRLQAWTRSEAGAADPGGFVLPSMTQFPTFDREQGRSRQIPVFLYTPPSAGPHPVLIALHDGPDTQYRPRFDPWIPYHVHELGFAVVAPNLRG